MYHHIYSVVFILLLTSYCSTIANSQILGALTNTQSNDNNPKDFQFPLIEGAASSVGSILTLPFDVLNSVLGGRNRPVANTVNDYFFGGSGERHPGFYTTHQGVQVCCSTCRSNDSSCLSKCTTNCVPSSQCNEAGKGAYAKYCSTKCNQLNGLEYDLPIRACEGECVAQTQVLCYEHECRDFGCRIQECSSEAPLNCMM